MLSTTAVQVFSLTFDIVGQVAMVVLIVTVLFFAKSLPQGNNPFLLNFFFITFLTQIPPSLLFFSGHLGREPPDWLCSTQSILMDGVSPMSGLAWVIVVFQTWSDFRATLRGEIPFGQRPSVKLLLFVTPYFAFLAWALASFAAVIIVPAEWQLLHLVFCANESTLGVRVRQSLGFTLFGIGCLQFYLESMSFDLNSSTHMARTLPVNFPFVFRVLVFCIAQLVPIVLAIVNSALFPKYIPMKQVTQMLVSTNAFVTFLVFGTQRHVMKAWKFWEWNATIRSVESSDSATNGSFMHMV